MPTNNLRQMIKSSAVFGSVFAVWYLLAITLGRIGVPGEIWFPIAATYKYFVFPHDRIIRAFISHPYVYQPLWGVLAAIVQWTIIGGLCAWGMRNRKMSTQVGLSIAVVVLIGVAVLALLSIVGISVA